MLATTMSPTLGLVMSRSSTSAPVVASIPWCQSCASVNGGRRLYRSLSTRPNVAAAHAAATASMPCSMHHAMKLFHMACIKRHRRAEVETAHALSSSAASVANVPPSRL